METNNIDKIVKDSLESRTIIPSNSSWERLSDQLDLTQEKKRKNWFLYVGYAATVLLLISVGFFMNSDDVLESITPNTIVSAPIVDTTKFVKPTLQNTVQTETVIVKTDTVEEKQQPKKTITKKRKPQIKQVKIIENNPIVIADNNSVIKKENRIIIDSNSLLKSVDNSMTTAAETKVVIPTATKKIFKQTDIKINSDALLYAVTNPDKDISEFYKKYNVDRDDVLKNIQKELQKVNLNIDANILLADVEKKIDEETFKKSFMQVVKGKITGLASAIANRNN
ncbi:MAG: hypothetical protein P8H13_10485 [Polaribacter sp.]|nr:hypothetical protein [Polaribacter sp.]MDG1812349.1 hypothetical protein [Polaribacter sp.]MDG1993168.1 hypothetical protein [Polaribacter sp.]